MDERQQTMQQTALQVTVQRACLEARRARACASRLASPLVALVALRGLVALRALLVRSLRALRITGRLLWPRVLHVLHVASSGYQRLWPYVARATHTGWTATWTAVRPAALWIARTAYPTLHRRRTRRIAVIVTAGFATAAVAVSMPALSQHPFPLLYVYMLFATWYGDVLEGACAVAMSVLSVVLCDLLLPSFPALPLEELVFVAASLWLLRVVQDLRGARQTAQRARQRAEEARQSAEEARARAEDARQRAEEARCVAEEALRVRDDFLTAASHDLRTPLTGILGHNDLMQMHLACNDTVDAQWLRGQVEAQRRAAKRMLSTVAEITDAAQLQTGRPLSLSMQAVDVDALIRDVAAEATALSRHQGRSLVVVDGSPGILTRGDVARLARVFQNIIGNAIKYSPRNTPVYVEVGKQADAVVVTVRDNGVGIPAEELPRIFERFYRASTSRGIAGSGIGLAGSKDIVAQHGGRISVESIIHVGTIVRVFLPLAAPTPHEGMAKDAHAGDLLPAAESIAPCLSRPV